MAEKAYKLTIETSADNSGTESATQALDQLGVSSEGLTAKLEAFRASQEEASDALDTGEQAATRNQASTIRMGQALAGAGDILRQVPGPVGELGNVLTALSGGPISVAIAAVGMLAKAYGDWSAAQTKAVEELQTLQDSEGTATVNREALTKATQAAKTAEEERNTALATTLQRMKAISDQTEIEIGLIEKLQKAQLERDKASVDRAVAGGQLSPAEGAAKKAALDEAATAQDEANARDRRQREVDDAAAAATVARQARDAAIQRAKEARDLAAAAVPAPADASKTLQSLEAQSRGALDDLGKFGTTPEEQAYYADPANRGLSDRFTVADGVGGSRQDVLDRLTDIERRKEVVQDRIKSEHATEKQRREDEATRAEEEAAAATARAADATQTSANTRVRANIQDRYGAQIADTQAQTRDIRGEASTAKAANAAAASAGNAAQAAERMGAATESAMARLAAENAKLAARLQQMETRFAAATKPGSKR